MQLSYDDFLLLEAELEAFGSAEFIDDLLELGACGMDTLHALRKDLDKELTP